MINYYVVRPIVCIMLKTSKDKFDAANVSGIHAKANIAILEHIYKGNPALGRELPNTKKPINGYEKHGRERSALRGRRVGVL